MNKKYVFVFDSLYSLLIYSILFTSSLKDTVFICSSDTSKNIYTDGYEVISVFRGGGIQGKAIAYVRFLFQLIANKKLRKIVLNKSEFEFFGQDHLFYSFPFIHRFTLIEDGLANYFPVRHAWYMRLFLGKKIFGKSVSVKDIYLSGMADIPNELQKKTKLFDLKYEWNKLSDCEKNIINKIFQYDLNQDSFERNIKTILLTQPLSEYNIISESEKVNIYREIIKPYDLSELVIRMHPRELTNYSEIFPGVKVNCNKLPIELILLNNKEINTAITLYSSGIYGIPCLKKIIKGTAFHSELKRKVGIINEKIIN